MTTNKLAAGLAAVRTSHHEPAPPEVNRPPSTVHRQRSTAPRWEDRVRRATFHIDIDVLDQLDATAARTGISKSEIVREAIRRHLAEL